MYARVNGSCIPNNDGSGYSIRRLCRDGVTITNTYDSIRCEPNTLLGTYESGEQSSKCSAAGNDHSYYSSCSITVPAPPVISGNLVEVK